MPQTGPKLSRKTEITINRLTSGHSLLAEHAHRMKLPSHPSPICSCGNARETVDHFLLHCSNFSSQRDKLIAAIERKFQSAGIPYHLRTFDMPLFAWYRHNYTHSAQIHRDFSSHRETIIHNESNRCFTERKKADRQTYPILYQGESAELFQGAYRIMSCGIVIV